MTKKLYQEDSHRTEFRAKVVDRRTVEGQPAVVLDRTCFYPTGGGQPHDIGFLNDVQVVDVLIDETDDEVLHVLAKELHGDTIDGVVDWDRRLEHMQQHTGQHILSEMFVRELGANTVSFHLGDEYSTIDLDRSPIALKDLLVVEDAANQIVFENRRVIARFVDQEELDSLPLRKPPTIEGPIRVVEVDGVDWSACGGTHCETSGEVGIIRISGTERRGNETRVTFLCGRRALQDYRQKDAILTELAGYLTTGYQDLPGVIRKMDEESRSAHRELQKTRESLATLEAVALLAEAEETNGVRLIVRSFDDRDFDAVKRLSAQLREQAGAVVLFGWKGPAKGQLLFGRAEDIDLDMLSLLRTTCKAVGGGGGGRVDVAQGGGMSSERIDEALGIARSSITG